MRFTFALAFNKSKIPKTQDFWSLINSGPEILMPKTAGVTEPLKRLEKLDIEEFDKEIIWKNGKKCLGYFQPVGFRGKATLSLGLVYPRQHHTLIVAEIYEWIKKHFSYRILYGVCPNEELYNQNLELQQMTSCGAIPPDESIIIDNAHLLEIFENNA